MPQRSKDEREAKTLEGSCLSVPVTVRGPSAESASSTGGISRTEPPQHWSDGAAVIDISRNDPNSSRVQVVSTIVGAGGGTISPSMRDPLRTNLVSVPIARGDNKPDPKPGRVAQPSDVAAHMPIPFQSPPPPLPPHILIPQWTNQNHSGSYKTAVPPQSQTGILETVTPEVTPGKDDDWVSRAVASKTGLSLTVMHLDRGTGTGRTKTAMGGHGSRHDIPHTSPLKLPPGPSTYPPGSLSHNTTSDYRGDVIVKTGTSQYAGNVTQLHPTMQGSGSGTLRDEATNTSVVAGVPSSKRATLPWAGVSSAGRVATPTGRAETTPASEKPRNPAVPRMSLTEGAATPGAGMSLTDGATTSTVRAGSTAGRDEPNSPVGPRTSSTNGTTTPMPGMSSNFEPTAPPARAESIPVSEKFSEPVVPRTSSANEVLTSMAAAQSIQVSKSPSNPAIPRMSSTNGATTPRATAELTPDSGKSLIVPKPKDKEGNAREIPGSISLPLPPVPRESNSQSAEKNPPNSGPGVNKNLLHVFQEALSDLGEALNTFIRKDNKAKAISTRTSEPSILNKPSADTLQNTQCQAVPIIPQDDPSLNSVDSERTENTGNFSAASRTVTDQVTSSLSKLNAPLVSLSVDSPAKPSGVGSPSGKLQSVYLSNTEGRNMPNSSIPEEDSTVPADVRPSETTPILSSRLSPEKTLSTITDTRHPSKMCLATLKGKGQPSKKSSNAKISYIIKPTVLESPERYVNDGHHVKPYGEPSSKFSLGKKEAFEAHITNKLKSRPRDIRGRVQHHSHWKNSTYQKLGSAGHFPPWKQSSGRHALGMPQNTPPRNGPGRIPPTTRNALTPPSPNARSEKISAGERSPVLSRHPQSYTPPGVTMSPPPASSPSPKASPSRVMLSSQPLPQDLPGGGSTSDGGGSSRVSRTKVQKGRSSVHPSSQPSFSDLLKIASHNAGKGPPASDLDYRLSRKRRHSDGQINRYKMQEGRDRPLDDPRLQRLESLSEPEVPEHTSSETDAPANLEAETPGCADQEEDTNPTSDQAGASNQEPPPADGESTDNKTGPEETHVEGIQGLFSELQSQRGETSSRESRSPSSSASMPSSPSSAEKKLLAMSQMRMVRVKLSLGLTLKKSLVEGVGTCNTPKTTERAPMREEDALREGDDVRREGDGTPKEEVGVTKDEADFSDSSDDDSFLLNKPAALIEETTALLDAPMPVTPSKQSLSTSFQPIPSSPGPTPLREQSPVEKKPNIRYTLDKMLHIKTVQERKYGDIGAIRHKLMDSVSTGGIAELAENVTSGDHDEDIDPTEYDGHLMRFDSEAEKIPEIPPGEEIFHKEDICQLFTPTQCLLNFQKMNRANGAEDLLGDSTIEEIEECIKTGFLECYYDGSQAPDSSMQWMFRLMSVHPSYHEGQVLYDTLWSQLNKAPLWLDEVHFPWTPTMKDIITVLLNYGGDIAGLISVSDCDVNFTLGNLRELDATAQDAARRGDEYCRGQSFFVTLLDNQLGLVLKVLTQAIITHLAMKNCSGYRTEELQCLFIIMLRIALDKRVVGHPVIVDISNAVSAIIEGFEDVVWIQQVERLCVLFPLITSHHHNMVYLIQNCIPLHLERGRYLYRMLGYAGLLKLVFPEKGWRDMTGHEVPDIKVSSLIPILHCCKPSRGTDYYLLNSIILLLDFSIGNERLETDEKRGLEKIIRKLREMVGDIRENALTLSRSQVKSLIVRTAAKLSFMTQSMITHKEGIFGFLHSDMNDTLDNSMNPEHHICSQTDPVSDGDESTTEMEADEDDGIHIPETGGDPPGVKGSGPPTGVKDESGETVVEGKGLSGDIEEEMDVGKDVKSSSLEGGITTNTTKAQQGCPSKLVDVNPGCGPQEIGPAEAGKRVEETVPGERKPSLDGEGMDLGDMEVAAGVIQEGRPSTVKSTDVGGLHQEKTSHGGKMCEGIGVKAGGSTRIMGEGDAEEGHSGMMTGKICQGIVGDKMDVGGGIQTTDNEGTQKIDGGMDMGDMEMAASVIQEGRPSTVKSTDVGGPRQEGTSQGGKMCEGIRGKEEGSARIMEEGDAEEGHGAMMTGKICQGVKGDMMDVGGGIQALVNEGTQKIVGGIHSQVGKSPSKAKAMVAEGEPPMGLTPPGKNGDPHRTDEGHVTDAPGSTKAGVSMRTGATHLEAITGAIVGANKAGVSMRTGATHLEAITEAIVGANKGSKEGSVGDEQQVDKAQRKESSSVADDREDDLGAAGGVRYLGIIPSREVTSLSSMMGNVRDSPQSSVPDAGVVRLSTPEVSGNVKMAKGSDGERRLAAARGSLGDSSKGGTREVKIKSETGTDSDGAPGTSRGAGGSSGMGALQGHKGVVCHTSLSVLPQPEVIDLTESSEMESIDLGSEEEDVIWLE